MKLELKKEEITPYLPYGLKVLSSFSESATISSLHLTDLESRKAVNLQLDGVPITFRGDNLDSIKPILRPLSDLTKEIEVNGNKFIPYEDDYLSDAICSYENLDLLCEYNGDISNDSTIPYPIMSLLFQWHFDVFGLIEKGLAIDINTI